MIKLLTVILLFSFYSILKAVEIITPFDEARRYLDANLVIVGEVISLEKKVIYDIDTLEADGWIHHYKAFVDIFEVKIDSIMKGTYTDSVIVIQSKQYYSHPSRSKFAGFDDKGDSVFVREGTI